MFDKHCFSPYNTPAAGMLVALLFCIVSSLQSTYNATCASCDVWTDSFFPCLPHGGAKAQEVVYARALSLLQ